MVKTCSQKFELHVQIITLLKHCCASVGTCTCNSTPLLKGPAFYPSTFIYSGISPKVQFLYCLLSSVVLWSGPMVDTTENFWNLGLHLAGKCIFLGFFLESEFHEEFWRKVDYKNTYNFPLCVILSI